MSGRGWSDSKMGLCSKVVAWECFGWAIEAACVVYVLMGPYE